MSGYNIKLNGITIKQPDEKDFKVSRFNVTKSGRVLSGDMTMDLVAKKRKFFFSYPVVSKKELDIILDIIDGNDMFFTLDYTENDVERSVTVYVGEISQTGMRSGGLAGWYWSDFNFNLIER